MEQHVGSGAFAVRRFAMMIAAMSLFISPVWGQSLATRVMQPRAVVASIPVEGTVEAVKQATVAAQVAGRVLEVHGDAGRSVNQGDVLVRIAARESAEAVAAATAALNNARINYERTQNLRSQKFVSQAAVDKAKAEYDGALAAEQASRATQAHSVIFSPLSGLIAARHTEQGEMATPGKPLFTVFDPRGLRLVVQVSQARLAEVKATKKAMVEFSGGRRVESESIQVLPTVDATTHVVEVRVLLPMLSGAVLPGMSGRVYFSRAEMQRLTLPPQALVRRGAMTAAYVRNAKGGFSLRQLRVGEATADGEVEILAGLVSGEEVALDAIKAGIASRPSPSAGRR